MSVQSIVGGSGSFSSTSGGKIYAFNAISSLALTTVAPDNPTRQKITFHNPGPNDAFVCPTTIANIAGGANSPFAPSTAQLGGVFRVFANGGTLVIDGECQQAWQAYSPTGAGVDNPLTVMDSNLS